MKASEITSETRANEHVFRLISFLLVALMLAAAALTVISVLTHIFSDWRPWYLAGICFVVALDSLYSYKNFKQLSLFTSEWFQAALTQLVILLVALRIVVGLSHGLAAFWQEVAAGWLPFLLSFLTVEFMIGVGMCILTYVISTSFAALLDELGLEAELIRQEQGLAVPDDLRTPREKLLSLVISVGTALVFLTALMRLDFRSDLVGAWDATVLEVPTLSNGGASTLLFFMLALALFSQTQFINLNTRWSLNRIPASRSIPGRWALYSLVFLFGLAAVVSLLPTSYSLGLLASLGYVLNLLGYLLFMLAQVIMTIVMFIISLPFLLFGRESPVAAPAIPPPPAPEALPLQTAAATAVPWLEVAKSVLFWAFLIGLVTFALLQYLRQHEELLAALRQRSGLSWLGQFWDWLSGIWKAAQKGISGAVSAGLERIRPKRSLAQTVGGWINLRKLGPRQRVFFFYQAFLRRSGESGLPRRLSQTPSEFASRLDSALPAAEPDIEALTGAFIEARYTPRPVEPEKANRVREVWEHLRKALRGKKVESGK